MKEELSIWDWGLCVGRKCIYENGDIDFFTSNTLALFDMNLKAGLADKVNNKFKPILKKLEDMTEEDKEELVELIDKSQKLQAVQIITGKAQYLFDYLETSFGTHRRGFLPISAIDWLTEKGFDVRVRPGETNPFRALSGYAV